MEPQRPSVADGPLTVEDRALTLDVLRGAALFGVLLVNMEFHRGPALYRSAAGLSEPGTGPLDDTVAFLIAWLAQGKAYTTLAFLFGYGAHVMFRRAHAAGVAIGPRFRRRLAGLLVLGVLHTVLLFFGDILVMYAVAGTTLLLAFRARDATLLAWAGGLVLGSAVLLALASLSTPALTPGEEADLLASAREAVSAYTGGAAEAIEQRMRDSAFSAIGFAANLPQVVGIFLIGVWCARRRLLERAGEHRAAWRRVALFGLAVGLPANLVTAITYTAGAPADPAVFALSSLGFWLGPLILAPAYVALVVLAAERLRRLAPLGRLSLTAYLAQSVVAAVLFTSYGLELYGDVGPAAGLALTVAIFAAEVALAGVWLRRHRSGPVERLLRAVTYRSAFSA